MKAIPKKVVSLFESSMLRRSFSELYFSLFSVYLDGSDASLRALQSERLTIQSTLMRVVQDKGRQRAERTEHSAGDTASRRKEVPTDLPLREQKNQCLRITARKKKKTTLPSQTLKFDSQTGLV